MSSIRTIPLVVAGLFLLSGCVTENPSVKIQSAPTPLQVKKEQVLMTVGAVPKWYLTQPKETDSYFASATSTSEDIQLAVDKATLSAKRILADRMDSFLSSKTKTVTTESKGENSSALVRTTTNTIEKGDSSGYSVNDVVVQQSGDLYRAYVLIEYVPW